MKIISGSTVKAYQNQLIVIFKAIHRNLILVWNVSAHSFSFEMQSNWLEKMAMQKKRKKKKKNETQKKRNTKNENTKNENA